MRRGTTPTHTFCTDLDMTDAEVIYVTYQQNGKTVLEKTREDVEVDGNKVIVKLTQEETLLFERRRDIPVRIQIRARWALGNAVASNIIETTAKEILKEGVI